MEGLAAGASVIAVVSIALQLADSIKRFSEFIGSIQEAPEEIESFLSDLQILSSVLDDIQLHPSAYNVNPSTEAILKNLHRKISLSMTLANRYELGLGSGSRRIRKWNALKVALKSEKLNKLRDSLNDTKITLIIALQSLSQINNLHISCQGRNSAILAGEGNVSQMKQASNIILTSSTEPTSLHKDYINDHTNAHISDLKEKIQGIASAMSTPIQKSNFVFTMHRFIQDSFSDLNVECDGLAPRRDAALESGTEVEGITDHCNQSPRDNESRLVISLDKKPSQRFSREHYRTIISTSKTLFGTVYLRTEGYKHRRLKSRMNKHAPYQVEYHFDSCFSLHPSKWMIWLGMTTSLDVMISKSIRGWKNSLKAFRAVPAEALIFDFCRKGNVEGVRTLLARGDASVWDRDPDGRTPLHFAMGEVDYQICELLINEGAETNALSFRGQTSPIMCSILRPKTFTSVHQRLIRMFFEYLDFSVQYGEGHIDNDRSWELFVLSTRSESDEIYDVIESDKGEEVYPRRDSICQLLLDVFGMDIKKNIRLVHIQEIWFNAQSLLFLKWFMSTIKSETGVTYRDIGQSLILRIASWTDISRFYWNNFELVRDKVKLLVVKGASLHYTMHRQSPTTVAMGKAFRFHWWCKILLALGTNIQSFVEDEIEQGPLQEEGWNKETLMELFRDLIRNNLDKVKLERFDISSCIKCGSLRRTLWEFHLEDIKSGDFICEVNDDEEFDDEEFNNDDDEVDDDEEVVVDDDEVDEVEEVDNDAETDDNGDSSNDEVYKRMLCDACRESLERPIPGSFVH